jgi:succinyl-diaminopimelate desuccinylase
MSLDKSAILSLISARESDYIELCSRIVQIPSENPPGDTTELARFVAATMRERGIDCTVYEPRPGNPTIVASTGSGRGKHLILNGHLDVFPADDASLWRTPPFSGLIADGRIHGRGAADMKAGTTASLATFMLLHETAPDLPGRVSLTLVSDEETGGAWGAKWLLENHPEYIGDGLLNAEPTGLDSVWVGEKGLAWLRLTSEGQAGHGSLGRGTNSITELARAVAVASTIGDLEGEAPHDVETLLREQSQRKVFDSDETLGDLLTHCSVNVGVISGGIKANILPRHAEAEVDIRIPLGIGPDDVYAEVKRRLAAAGINSVGVEPVMHQSLSASVMNLSDPLLGMLRDNARAISGREPRMELCPGATDGRFWRTRGVPTVIYGPASHGMAEPDEYIEISDFLTTLRVHAATAVEFLGRA